MAIFAEPDVILRAAKPAIFGAAAAPLNLVAHGANEILGHGRSLAEVVVHDKVTNGSKNLRTSDDPIH